MAYVAKRVEQPNVKINAQIETLDTSVKKLQGVCKKILNNLYLNNHRLEDLYNHLQYEESWAGSKSRVDDLENHIRYVHDVVNTLNHAQMKSRGNRRRVVTIRAYGKTVEVKQV